MGYTTTLEKTEETNRVIEQFIKKIKIDFSDKKVIRCYSAAAPRNMKFTFPFLNENINPP